MGRSSLRWGPKSNGCCGALGVHPAVRRDALSGDRSDTGQDVGPRASNTPDGSQWDTMVDTMGGRYEHASMPRRTARTNPLAAVAYIRVSTERQELGPEAQRAAIERWAGANGIAIVAWHVDQGVSGATELADRPGMVAALADLRAVGAGVLVAAKRDRIARDPMVARHIGLAAKVAGATLRTADGVGDASGPEGVLMTGMVDLFAEHERLLIGARTKAALAAKAVKGERVGTVPYGYAVAADGKTLVADAAEQEVLAVVRELRAAGLSVRAIVGALAAKGIVSRRGHPFAKSQVHAMVA